jgi:hypothetical protein
MTNNKKANAFGWLSRVTPQAVDAVIRGPRGRGGPASLCEKNMHEEFVETGLRPVFYAVGEAISYFFARSASITLSAAELSKPCVKHHA